MTQVTRRSYASIALCRLDDEGVSDSSSQEQKEVEESCLAYYARAEAVAAEIDELPRLKRAKTIGFLRKGLSNLSRGYECLDASRPWLVYWIVHSLELLGESFSDAESRAIVEFLSRCQSPSGGYGGGPGQLPHLAPTYAAVNALCIIGTEQALQSINRPALVSWLERLRLSDGSFTMHQDGEVDIRGVYCALSVARLTNIFSPQVFQNTDQWLLRCQTYEGGFGGVPGMEAHGGYSFCGLAALLLLGVGKALLCDLTTLLSWGASRQMRLEGGFQGRTNKLVDGCYSFWQGGLFPLVDILLSEETGETRESLPQQEWLFDSGGLQEYLLLCCQDMRGGLVDKPGKDRDYYHTCYTLSGLSLAQHHARESNTSISVLGHEDNLLEPTHPLYNIGLHSYRRAGEYYNGLEVPLPVEPMDCGRS